MSSPKKKRLFRVEMHYFTSANGVVTGTVGYTKAVYAADEDEARVKAERNVPLSGNHQVDEVIEIEYLDKLLPGEILEAFGVRVVW